MSEQPSIEVLLASRTCSCEWMPTRSGIVYVRRDGKIIGEVASAIGPGYHAIANGRHLGTFYTERAPHLRPRSRRGSPPGSCDGGVRS